MENQEQKPIPETLTTPSVQPSKESKSKKPIFLIVVICILIIGGGVLVWQFLGRSGQEIFRNDEYGFEIKYPKNWFVKEESSEDYYRLDIYHPKNIEEVEIWGDVAVEFFTREDNDQVFERQLDVLKNKITVGIFEEISINGVGGYKRTENYEIDKARGTTITVLFPSKGCRILTWSAEFGNKYEKKTQQILSTFKFLD